MNTNQPQLILASSSPYRKALLERLTGDFTTQSPDIDESPKTGETAEQLVARLSIEKAKAVDSNGKYSLVIGSDQVCIHENEILGKPGNHQNATEQLRKLSGHRVTFLTGLALLNSDTGNVQIEVIPFHVYFRPLSAGMIEKYLQREKPYNCAGSFKSEGLGSVLFEKLEGDDPSSLIGLPLIRLIRMLENEKFELLN